MKLAPQKLEQHLKQGLQALYVLTGDEPLSQRECLDTLRQCARKQGFDERTSLTVDRYFKWHELTHFGQATSLFASLRLLELNIPSGKPGLEGSKAIQALCEQPIPDTVVLIILPKIEWKEQKTAWFMALEQHSVMVTLEETAPAQLPAWIAQRLAAQGQQADTETLQFIAHQVEGNLLAAHQEIQKFGLLFPAGTLALADIKSALLNVSRYDAFQLGEAVLAGEPERTARILQGLQDEGENVVAVTSPVLWAMRPLVRLKQAEIRGENVMSAMTNARIFGDKQSLYKRALARLSLKQLEAALIKLTEIDRSAKGVLAGDAWLELSRLCFGLARVSAKKR